MRIGCALAIACACCGPSRAPVARGAATPQAARVPPAQVAAAGESEMVPVRGSAREPVLGPPRSNSIELATTPDGSAAVTVDADGGVRLWPALDGAHEPRAVAITAPVHGVSIVRSGAGFLVASIDEGRDLTLTQLDADGRVLAHRALGGDPGFSGTAAIDGGVLAWASDETIAWFGADGSTRGRLGSLPGERIAELATRGAHAIAVVERSGEAPRFRVRMLAVAPDAAGSAAPLAWGDTLTDAYEVALPVAISPSGKRIAFRTDATLVALDVATRQPILTGATPGGDRQALAFFDDDHLADSATSTLIEWYAFGGSTVPPNTPANGTAGLAAGPGALVALVPGGLAFAAPNHPISYLGYAVVDPTTIASGGSGEVAIANEGGLAMLVDAGLRDRGHFDLGVEDAKGPQSMAWLGGDDWLVLRDNLRVVSAVGKPPLAVAAPEHEAMFVRTEPRAHLAATAFGLTAALYRWDAAARAMQRVARMNLPSPYGMVAFAPTRPDLAGGVKVVRAVQNDTATIEWFADEKMATPEATATAATVLAIDAAARVYAWTLGEQAHIAILANGAEIGQLPATTSALYPEPVATPAQASGARVAAIAGDAVELYTGATLAWSRSLSRPRSLAWLDDGGLAVLVAGGVVRLDAATGEIAAHRCGWGFGFWPAPLAMAQGDGALCDLN